MFNMVKHFCSLLARAQLGLRFTWTADRLNTQVCYGSLDILGISVQVELLMIHLPPLPKSEAIGMPPHLENVCLWFLKETELGPQFMWPGISSDIGLVLKVILWLDSLT